MMTPDQIQRFRDQTNASAPFGWTFLCKRCRGIHRMEKRKLAIIKQKRVYLCPTCWEKRNEKLAEKLLAAATPTLLHGECLPGSGEDGTPRTTDLGASSE